MLVPVKSFRTTTVYPIGPKYRDERNRRARFSPRLRVVNVLLVGVNHRFEEEEYFNRLKLIVTNAIPDLFVYTEIDEPLQSYKREGSLSNAFEFANTILEYFMMNEGRSELFARHAMDDEVSETTLTIKTQELFEIVDRIFDSIEKKYRDLIGCSPVIFEMIKLEIKKLEKFEVHVDDSINSNSTIEYFFMSIFPYLVEYFSTLFEESRACTETKKNKGLRKYDDEIFSSFKRVIESHSPLYSDDFMEIRDKTTVGTFEEMLRNDEHETNNIMFIFGTAHIKSLTEKLKNLNLTDINIKLNISVSKIKDVTDVIEITNKTLSFFGKPERRQSQRVVDQRKKEYLYSK